MIAPSNPIVSVGPILAVGGMRGRDRGGPARPARRSSPSRPIVGGRALKGPADRMLASLGHESSALGVARLYAGLVDGFRPRRRRRRARAAVEALGLQTLVTDTLMIDDASRVRLAGEVLAFARGLAPVRG